MSEEKTLSVLTQNREFKLPLKKLKVPFTKNGIKTLQKYFENFYRVASSNVTTHDPSVDNIGYTIVVNTWHSFSKKDLRTIVEHLNMFFDTTTQTVLFKTPPSKSDNGMICYAFTVCNKNSMPKKNRAPRTTKKNTSTALGRDNDISDIINNDDVY